ncbi:MAG TPA: response regulator transcription factor [Firmicutes bacterium]|nr:response regulator transcription factor [Bacillota bacterium]
MPRILVVEDEKPIAQIIEFRLKKEGFQVDSVATGEQAIAYVRKNVPDMILLDIMLPGLDGFATCREIRRMAQVPIIMVTAKEAEGDKILGLELGADDYVTKPFSPRELIARVKAVLRRTSSTQTAGDSSNGVPEPTKITIGPLTVDSSTYEATRNGEKVALTVREFELLRYLMVHPGRVLTREQLLKEVWGYECPVDTRTVDVTVRRLREKIEDDPAAPQFIQTRRGVGYFFQSPSTEERGDDSL